MQHWPSTLWWWSPRGSRKGTVSPPATRMRGPVPSAPPCRKLLYLVTPTLPLRWRSSDTALWCMYSWLHTRVTQQSQISGPSKFPFNMQFLFASQGIWTTQTTYSDFPLRIRIEVSYPVVVSSTFSLLNVGFWHLGSKFNAVTTSCCALHLKRVSLSPHPPSHFGQRGEGRARVHQEDGLEGKSFPKKKGLENQGLSCPREYLEWEKRIRLRNQMSVHTTPSWDRTPNGDKIEASR